MTDLEPQMMKAIAETMARLVTRNDDVDQIEASAFRDLVTKVATSIVMPPDTVRIATEVDWIDDYRFEFGVSEERFAVELKELLVALLISAFKSPATSARKTE
ncbi:hypothetical protein [Roseicella sp. DB1501]|uniref:hypothetical protein n=1 Tax=Roseicella sp. DB1501 TaxID=2730925 RepID=UPI0014918978|nr:hypothetical protein [Roseicella sp. DB1501]NOG71322.1 hypothetical protein [Roseicella sp. DB1501]